MGCETGRCKSVSRLVDASCFPEKVFAWMIHVYKVVVNKIIAEGLGDLFYPILRLIKNKLQ